MSIRDWAQFPGWCRAYFQRVKLQDGAATGELDILRCGQFFVIAPKGYKLLRYNSTDWLLVKEDKPNDPVDG